jgi:hypothetical protein
MAATCKHCKMPIIGLEVKTSRMFVRVSGDKMVYTHGRRACFKCPECRKVLFYNEDNARDFLLEIPPPVKKQRSSTTSKW